MDPWPCSREEARIKWCLRLLPCLLAMVITKRLIVFRFLLWGKRSKAIPDPSIQSVSYNINYNIAICRTVPKAARAIYSSPCVFYARSAPGNPIVAAFSDSFPPAAYATNRRSGYDLYIPISRRFISSAMQVVGRRSRYLVGTQLARFFATPGHGFNLSPESRGCHGAEVSHGSPEPRNRRSGSLFFFTLSCLKTFGTADRCVGFFFFFLTL